MTWPYWSTARYTYRHDLWKQKFPGRQKAKGIPFTGLSNARPETRAIAEHLEALREQLPSDPFEFMDWEPPHGLQKVDMID